jgi:hypothetical protein
MIVSYYLNFALNSLQMHLQVVNPYELYVYEN